MNHTQQNVQTILDMNPVYKQSQNDSVFKAMVEIFTQSLNNHHFEYLRETFIHNSLLELQYKKSLSSHQSLKTVGERVEFLRYKHEMICLAIIEAYLNNTHRQVVTYHFNTISDYFIKWIKESD